MNKKNAKMNTKRILVSFFVIASVLFLASMVSAALVITSVGDYDNIVVKVNGEQVSTQTSDLPSVVAGDTITVKVSFKYIGTDNDNIRVKAIIEGKSDDVTVSSSSFDVENNGTYSQILTLKVPSDFEKDSLNADLPLTIKIGNEEVELGDLHVQKVSYDIAIKSVMTSNSVEVGELLPVDIVLKNTGYNDLNDLYVTVKIPELGIEKSAYFGDLVPLKDCSDDDCDNENTVTGRLYLEIPYNVRSGIYTLQVKAENEDAKSIVSKEIVINNGVPELAMKSGTNSLTLLNPTNQLQVYTVKYLDKQVSVVMSPASSKDVTLEIPTGEYKFDVVVYSGNTPLGVVNFSGTNQAAATQLTSPVLVLTVILAIVFVVLLVVLVVLITRKPQKTEEFGESYY